MHVRVLALTASILTLLVLAIATAPPALAHVRLVASDPSGGATIDVPPRRVRLTFSEAVDSNFARVTVTDPDGERVDVGTAQVNDEVVTIGLSPSLQPGRYTVAFRVVSLDEHPIEAGFRFTLTEAAGTDPSPSSSPEPSVRPSPPPAPTPEPVPSTAAAVPPSEVATTPTSTNDGATTPQLLLVVVLIAAVFSGGTYMIVRRRTDTP